MSWQRLVLERLKANRVSTLVHVPDIILADVIRTAESDPYFQVVGVAREEEGVGVVCGAYLGGRRGALLMQNSGAGNAANALASLAAIYQVPFLMFISQRGELGEFNPAQVPMGQALRPLLDALGIQHYTLDDESRVDAVLAGAAKLAFSTERPVALIISTLLSGGKEE